MQERERKQDLTLESASEIVTEFSLEGSVEATLSGVDEAATEERSGLKTITEKTAGAEELPQGVAIDGPLEDLLDELRYAARDESATEPNLLDVDSDEVPVQTFEASLTQPVALELIPDNLEHVPWELEEAADVVVSESAEAPTPGPTYTYSGFGTNATVATKTGIKRSSLLRSTVPLLLVAGVLALFLTRNSWVSKQGDAGGDWRSGTSQIAPDPSTATTPPATPEPIDTAAVDGNDGSDELSGVEGNSETGGAATTPVFGAPTDEAPSEPTDSSEAGDTEVATEGIEDFGVVAPVPTDREAPLRLARGAIRGWATAWANQDVEAYLGSYSRDFQPTGGLSREAWEAKRRERLTAPTSIEVELSEIDVRIGENDHVTATFVQQYRSDRYRDAVKKNLELVREQGQWKILKEWLSK